MYTEIKTFEDACKALGLDPNQLPDVTLIPDRLKKWIIAAFKLAIIAEALNEGWKPDWSNHDQWKYFAWFAVAATKENPSGSGFSDSDCDDSNSGTGVSSCLCYKSSDIALYAGKQFEELYKNYLLMD